MLKDLDGDKSEIADVEEYGQIRLDVNEHPLSRSKNKHGRIR